MNKLLLCLLSLLALSSAMLPTASHAASADDFVTLEVPNLHQATDFFSRVMNCNLIGSGTSGALLDCGDGTVVQLSAQTSAAESSRHRSSQRISIITLHTDNAVAAAHWLRINHVRLAGGPSLFKRADGSAEVVVNFLSPWGQPMQLVSENPTSRAMNALVRTTQLASQ